MKKLYALEHWSDMWGKGNNYYSSFSFIESNKFPNELIEHESDIQDETLYERWVKVHEVTKEFLENNFEYINFCHSERDKKHGRWWTDKWTMDDVIRRIRGAVNWMNRTVEQCKILHRYPEFSMTETESNCMYCETRQYRYSYDRMYPNIDHWQEITYDLARELNKLGYTSYVDAEWKLQLKPNR
jgi:hypothetical protein